LLRRTVTPFIRKSCLKVMVMIKSEQQTRVKARNKSLLKLQNVIGYRFSEVDLLDRALTHRSFINETVTRVTDNERLEYLGDSVLGLIVNEYLFKRFDNYHEGDLAKIKSVVVSEDTLTKIAQEISIGEYLLLGKGEENCGGRTRPSILANTVEAVIASIYLDGGLVKTKKIVLHYIKKYIDQVDRLPALRDPKTSLQEIIQKKYKDKPIYRLVEESGPDHKKQFIVQLVVRNKDVVRGIGTSIRRAETDAAKNALLLYHKKELDL
jgi:ribonuclease III